MQKWSYKRGIGGILLKNILRYENSTNFRRRIMQISPIKLLKKFPNHILMCFTTNVRLHLVDGYL